MPCRNNTILPSDGKTGSNPYKSKGLQAAVILVLVIGTIRLVGGNANNVFSSVASTMQ